MERILWVAATHAELACLPRGTWAVATGCGPAAAAAGLALELGGAIPDRIVGIGIAGAYPSSPFHPPQVVRVESDGFIDLGAETSDGFASLWNLGIPDPGVPQRFQSQDAPFFAHLPAARGATCSVCTGTSATAAVRESTGAQIETMEGAAWALVSQRRSIPFCQVRAISNAAGVRDRSTWKIHEALTALAMVLKDIAP